MQELAARIVQGEVAALARACRIVDERVAGYRELLTELFPFCGRARTLGITGSPGVGKSTLSDQLVAALRARGERVGVIAIDPSSPFSGGALLGDRIRMQRHALDPGVFMRSLASRGAHGGLSRSTADTLRLVEAWGASSVLVESVGVGQAELELLGAVDSIVVVAMPGAGDDVQANKAGIVEIADVLVLNKADRPLADAAIGELSLSLALSTRREPDAWSVPIVKTVATRAEGVSELLEALDRHRRFLLDTASGRAHRAARQRENLGGFLRTLVADEVLSAAGSVIDELVERVVARELDPYQASSRVLAEFNARWVAKPSG